jgi:hypothetical protein
MAYQETPAEKSARKAREEANAKKGAEALKKADYEAFGSRGDAAVQGMEEGRMDAMGTAYKKGGKVKSASKRADGCCIRGKTKA